MAHANGQTDNHKAEEHVIPPSLWNTDIEIDKELIEKNLLEIKKNIAPCKPKIIGITKYYGLNVIKSGYEAGIRDFGESRVADAINKIEMLPNKVRKNSTFHFIGHLQTNKTAKVVKYFDYIHSVDSLKLAIAISDFAKNTEKTIKILLQLNNSGEEQKFGYSKAQLIEDFPKIVRLNNIEVTGLMNMAPLGASEETLRFLFNDVRTFRDTLENTFNTKLPELSMGMSDDYIYAAQSGATMIRIGRKLFN